MPNPTRSADWVSDSYFGRTGAENVAVVAYGVAATSGSMLVVVRLINLSLNREYKGEMSPPKTFTAHCRKFLHHITMNEPRQAKVHTSHRLSRPPLPSPIDVLIDRNQGSSVALEATSARMEASKRMMILTPYQKNMQLNKDNAALRAEMARLHKLESANAYFTKDIKEALGILQQAVFEWRKAQKDIDNEFSQNTPRHSTETGKIQIGMDRFQ